MGRFDITIGGAIFVEIAGYVHPIPAALLGGIGALISDFIIFDIIRFSVFHDEIDLAPGRFRMKTGGGAAGQNGVRSLISHLGTQDFPRLKVGIAPQEGRPVGERMVGHVLGKFRPDEQPALQIIIQRAADAVLMSLQRGLEQAMNVFNQQQPAV